LGILGDIIKEDSFLFEDDVDEAEFNNHHVIPLGVKKEIEKKNIEAGNRKSKNKNRDFKEINELDCLLSKIELDLTKRVLKRLHDNYNQMIIIIKFLAEIIFRQRFLESFTLRF
jgi:hypothetical protein